MIEVIIASLLFAGAAAGIFATISYTNTSTESESKVKAARFSKKILDQLNKDVTSSAGATSFTNGVHNWPADAEFPGYTATYTVWIEPSGARKVTVNAVWP